LDDDTQERVARGPCDAGAGLQNRQRLIGPTQHGQRVTEVRERIPLGRLVSHAPTALDRWTKSRLGLRVGADPVTDVCEVLLGHGGPADVSGLPEEQRGGEDPISPLTQIAGDRRELRTPGLHEGTGA
jgi:hypothetical protein